MGLPDSISKSHARVFCTTGRLRSCLDHEPGSSDQRLSQPTHPRKLSLRVRPALLLTGMLASLAVSWGCSGVVRGNSVTPPPPTQTYNISGTISPAAGGNGAAVTLSGTASATTT